MEIRLHRGAVDLLGRHDEEIDHDHDGQEDYNALNELKNRRKNALNGVHMAKFLTISVGDIIKAVKLRFRTRSSAG